MLKSAAYNTVARIAPAGVTVMPTLVLALTLFPALEGWARLAPVASLGLLTWASLTARKRGNDVQKKLWASWGGAPSIQRLRFSSGESPAEVERRHRDVEAATFSPLRLPSSTFEQDQPSEADREYRAANGRLINICHEDGTFKFLDRENRNYGFARNLYGLKYTGIVVAIATAIVSLGLAAVVSAYPLAITGASASVLVGIAAASLLYLLIWRYVKGDWVRPSAESYADRLMGAASYLARKRSGSDSAEEPETPRDDLPPDGRSG